jgi:hypothetical protein
MAQLRASLKELEVAADRLQAVDVLGDLAAVWAELLEFEQAILLYERALAFGGSSVSMRALEQIGNLQIRQASRLRHGGQADVAELIKKAKVRLDQALSVGASGERYALLGSYHKKCATMTTGAQRREHIEAAITCYAQANALQPRPYHELNARQLTAVCRLCGSEPPPEPSKLTSPSATSSDPGAEANDQKPDSAPDFWERSRQGDLSLTQLLETAAARPGEDSITSDVIAEWEASVRELVAQYIAAFRLRSSARERASVVDHVDDLAELIPEDHPLSKALLSASQVLSQWPAVEPP